MIPVMLAAVLERTPGASDIEWLQAIAQTGFELGTAVPSGTIRTPVRIEHEISPATMQSRLYFTVEYAHEHVIVVNELTNMNDHIRKVG